MPYFGEKRFKKAERLKIENECKQLGLPPSPGVAAKKELQFDELLHRANSIFGFNGWSHSVTSETIDFVDCKSGKYDIGISALVKVMLKDGTHHEELGYGIAKGLECKGTAFEKARKTAATNALKNALQSFGKVFENALPSGKITDFLSPTQTSSEAAMQKSRNFLSTLIKLAEEQPKGVTACVKQIIQGLIDGTLPPEDFISKLETQLNASHQPCLLPFLKESLPYLRHSLFTKEVTIEGVNPPPLTAHMLPVVSALPLNQPPLSNSKAKRQLMLEFEDNMEPSQELSSQPNINLCDPQPSTSYNGGHPMNDLFLGTPLSNGFSQKEQQILPNSSPAKEVPLYDREKLKRKIKQVENEISSREKYKNDLLNQLDLQEDETFSPTAIKKEKTDN